jgi:hypothetical protein
MDNFTRYCYIYLMQQKSEALDKFIYYKFFVEKQTNRKIKILRSDHGGEYMSKDFDIFCSKEGIKKEFTTTYMP